MSPVATVPIDLTKLQRGDLLLYGGGGLFNLVIQTKTWSHFSHVEVFDLHFSACRRVAWPASLRGVTRGRSMRT